MVDISTDNPIIDSGNGVNLEGVNDAANVADSQDTSNVQDTGASDAGNIGNDGVASQKPVQSADDNARFAAARREAEAQARALKERQDNFARQFGYDSFEEMEYAQQIRQYTDQGIDPVVAEMKIKQEKLEQMIAMQGHQTRIQQEKAALQNQKFFKELEPEIDATLKINPSLSVRDVFDYIKGRRMDELLSKETAAAKQRQLNSINGKSHIRSDSGSVDNDFIDIDPEEFKVAKALNPKETLESYRAWKKSQK